MIGSEVPLTYVMISIACPWKKRKGGIVIIVTPESIPCPICGGRLFTRGTCRRKAKNSAGITTIYQLRVLQCSCCHKTHREIPDFLVPYKRYEAEAIMHIASTPESAPCERRTSELIREWLAWFIVYANNIRESLSLILSMPLPKLTGKIDLLQLMILVRSVVNSGNWAHNRTEFSCF